MKRDIRSSPLVKALAVLLAMACGVGAFLSWAYCGIHWDSLFRPGDYTRSAAYEQAMNDRYVTLIQLLDYEQLPALNYLEQKDYDALKAALEPSVTNFRCIVRDNANGEILFSSAGAQSLDNVSDVRTATVFWQTAAGMDSGGESADYGAGEYSPNDLPGELSGRELALEYGADRDLPVDDAFSAARDGFTRGDINYLYAAAGLTLGFAALTVFLMSCAGRRKSAGGYVLSWQDKVPSDLYLCLSVPAGVGCAALAVNFLRDALFYSTGSAYSQTMYAGAAAAFAAACGLFEAGAASLAVRCKTRTLFRNTLLWRLFAWVGRCCGRLGAWWKATFGSWDLTKRVILGFFLYLAGTVLTGLTLVLIPFYQGAVLYLLCRWVREWKVIRDGTRAIVGGRPDTVVDTAGMKRFPDLAEHAGQLNDLGSAINSAVEERMKSERMKAALITNVSHDLKTPLTSIINYVDLLKKEDIGNETAREYLDVLDRKSQRLKKLTEDLVEASKASTGALTVTRERLGMTQLVSQALGEYSEKLAAAGLTPVVKLPEEEVFVRADGRHVWRILDNLMGNCVKYALPGTRVYLDVVGWDGSVTLSLKNISATQLNVSSEQLMERFVRGDESRATEGSGLGLSIARSLTELQEGAFRVEVDGDLFKAVVSFPEVK